MTWLKRTYAWSGWDYARTYLPYFLGGLAVAAAIDLATRVFY